jgi:hypothetical protein
MKIVRFEIFTEVMIARFGGFPMMNIMRFEILVTVNITRFEISTTVKNAKFEISGAEDIMRFGNFTVVKTFQNFIMAKFTIFWISMALKILRLSMSPRLRGMKNFCFG